MATLIVRFRVEGFHCWPGAKDHPGREYLADRHRHLFYVQASMPLHHDEREIEFHDVLAAARELFPGGDMGAMSCETMARNLAEHLCEKYKRAAKVSVFEDGEVGAEVEVWGNMPAPEWAGSAESWVEYARSIQQP